MDSYTIHPEIKHETGRSVILYIKPSRFIKFFTFAIFI